ncbi:MAG TPA: serine/threonine-protein kinase [Verrucomicrobiae bacterium]
MKIETQLQDAICLAALEVSDPVQRKSFLDRACAGDDQLRAKVEEMLALEQDAENFFARGRSAVAAAKLDLPLSDAGASSAVPAVEAAEPADPQIGVCVGRYKLLQRLGEGGCGTVYMAEQEEPVRRRVAVKIVKPGMDTKSVIARFAVERQALAMMDHPNIARVLDAGETEFGRPYFVMELVRGTRITQFCDENNFSTRQRLELFIQVCRAIQHAHQKGIIHRDVKPSNILVTLHDGMPVPKVIDFGIAKATEGRLTDNTMFTAYEQFLGTPAYMSPEQAEMSGLDVDTRSDIYSLGVLLYELLTGRTPFDSKTLLESGFDAMRKTLREKEPLAPSTMIMSLKRAEMNATAAHRFVDPANLVSQLKGDLDWIVLKALEKDRTRRYETVNGLAMDVQRYLNNEPVYARPPSRLYRFQKLVRRNRAVFISAAAVSLALIAGFGTSTWLFFKEREARREAQQGREAERQARLEAQKGREAEALLRRKAEAREVIAQAVLLIEKNQFDRADRLIGDLPASDAADVGIAVFRPLGDWMAVHGNWRRAAEYYSVVVRLDLYEKSEISTKDYTKYAVVLTELGDRHAYEDFCRESIKQFASMPDSVIAERIVKNSLLMVPSPNLLTNLTPFAALAEASIPKSVVPSGQSTMYAWRCLSLALFEYRRGNYTEAINWCLRETEWKPQQSPARSAAIKAIMAMSYHQQGRDEQALAELAESRQKIEDRSKTPFVPGDDIVGGLWFDWFLAIILEREASAVVGNSD